MAFDSLEDMISSFFVGQEARAHIKDARKIINPRDNPVIAGHPPLPFHVTRHEVTLRRLMYHVVVEGWFGIGVHGKLHINARGMTSALHNALGAYFTPTDDICFDSFIIHAKLEDSLAAKDLFEQIGSQGPRFEKGEYICAFDLRGERFLSRVLNFRHESSRRLWDKEGQVFFYDTRTNIGDRQKSDMYYHIAHILRGKVMLHELYKSSKNQLSRHLHDVSNLSRFMLEQISDLVELRCDEKKKLENLSIELEEMEVDVWPFLDLRRKDEPYDVELDDIAYEFRKRILAKPVFDLKKGIVTFESVATRDLRRGPSDTGRHSPYRGQELAALAHSYYSRLYGRLHTITLGAQVRMPFDIIKGELEEVSTTYFIRFPNSAFKESQEGDTFFDFCRFLAEYANDSQVIEDLVASADCPLKKIAHYLEMSDCGSYPNMPDTFSKLLDRIENGQIFEQRFLERENEDSVDFVFETVEACAQAVYHMLLCEDLAAEYANMQLFQR